jgi:glycosyltransferase involved in cell wall biosynthesis
MQLDFQRNLSGLKVCFLAGTLGQGGAERQLFYMLKALRRSGAQAQVLSLTKGEFWESRIQELGVPVVWIGQQRSHFKRLFRIATAARKSGAQILQSQHFFCNAYAAAASGLLNVFDVGAMRTDGANEVRDCGALRGWLNLHSPRMLAANCRPAIRYAESRGVSPERLYFLPNVIEPDQFMRNGGSTESRPTNGFRLSPTNGLRLILTGRLVEQKRVDRFLDVLARVRKLAGEEVSGIVVGTGPLKAELEQRARQLNLGATAIEFRGPAADMAPLYHEAAVCVLTSDFEGTPNVLLEAMAAGLPVVATNVGGVSDIVRHGDTGFLFDPSDVTGMTQGLARLIQNPELRAQMGAAAQRFVTTNHALELLPGFLQALYRKRLDGVSPHLREHASPKPAMTPVIN